MSETVPTVTAAYLERLLERLRGLLGDELVGVYAGGSLALGGYDPARSDVDVAVVCRRPLSPGTKAAIAAALRHEVLPCPARGLELVVYAEATARAGSRAPGFELNLNTGAAMPYHFSPLPGDGAGHWFPIDRAILHEHGLVLLGPPPEELFTPLPRAALLGLLAESMRWHLRAGAARPDDAVLNACRALRFAADGTWVSKVAAGEWARGRADDPGLVEVALRARAGGPPPDPARVERFVARVEARLTRGSSRF